MAPRLASRYHPTLVVNWGTLSAGHYHANILDANSRWREWSPPTAQGLAQQFASSWLFERQRASCITESWDSPLMAGIRVVPRWRVKRRSHGYLSRDGELEQPCPEGHTNTFSLRITNWKKTREVTRDFRFYRPLQLSVQILDQLVGARPSNFITFTSRMQGSWFITERCLKLKCMNTDSEQLWYLLFRELLDNVWYSWK